MLCTALPHRILSKGDNLQSYILESFKKNTLTITEYSVLVVSSKLAAVSQGRISSDSLRELVMEEADEILVDKEKFLLTVKNGIVIANAGIDLSNSETKECILWPENPQGLCDGLRFFLQNHFGVKNIGVILSDSRVTMRRKGTVGVALAWSGIVGIKDERGTPDLFGRPLTVSTVNIADNLTSAAEILMGQAAECTPLVLISQLDPIHFTDTPQDFSTAQISEEEDLFIDTLCKK